MTGKPLRAISGRRACSGPVGYVFGSQEKNFRNLCNATALSQLLFLKEGEETPSPINFPECGFIPIKFGPATMIWRGFPAFIALLPWQAFITIWPSLLITRSEWAKQSAANVSSSTYQTDFLGVSPCP